MQRTASESGASAGATTSKVWQKLRKLREERSKANLVSKDEPPDDSVKRTTSHPATISDSADGGLRQLQALSQKMRSAPSGPNHVDAAYKEFSKLQPQCAQLCRAVLQLEDARPTRSLSNATESLTRRDSSFDTPHSPGPGYGPTFDQRSSFSGQSLGEVMTGTASRNTQLSEAGLGAVREWKSCLETLADAFRTSLAETYKSYERDATPEMLEALFNSKKFRREAVHRMRNASVTRVLSADPQFFPRYEIRFRNYEKVKLELAEIRSLVQSGESGITPSRRVEEYIVAGRGDALLEFANLQSEVPSSEPVLRFRVSSHLLAEASPIFARMFSNINPESLHVHEDEDLGPQLPPPPTRYVCTDGSEVRLYRMPQYELNRLKSFEILLHAAHMHNEVVPREVSFEQFVAIAQCSIRYKSTSPLELMVEHRWMPQWMHNGADDMPDGLLVISYAFGLRQLFTRMSKSAVLNLVDERDLLSKPWPPRLRDKIRAVRSAKMDQVYACCTSTVQDYIRQPTRNAVAQSEPVTQSELRANRFSAVIPPQQATDLSSKPRCPKGSHACDAQNLGWMLLLYNEMNLLDHVVQPSLLAHVSPAQPGGRSLAQIFDALRRVPSPVSPVHRGGVCDPGPTFRAAVNDIFGSVLGLTLHDVSGKSHGWALSKHRMAEPQELGNQRLHRMAAPEHNYTVVTEFPETVRLRVLGEIADLDDLYAAAMINRTFYETYKTHELFLMRNILRQDRARTGTLRVKQAGVPSGANHEEKVPKDVSDLVKEQTRGLGIDAQTLRSDEDSDESISDEDEDEEEDAVANNAVLFANTPTHVQRHDNDSGERTPRAVSAEGISPRQPPNAHMSTEAAPSLSRPHNSEDEEGPGTSSDDYTPDMTDEEALRILYGPDVSSQAASSTPRPRPRTQYSAGAPSPHDHVPRTPIEIGIGRVHGDEQKVLVTAENKLRRIEADEGGLKLGPRPGTAGMSVAREGRKR